MINFIFNNEVIIGFLDSEADMLKQDPLFERLTVEQEHFYSEQPSASISEVRACRLSPPQEVPLEEYKKQIIRDLDMLSLCVYDQLCPAYVRDNARISLEQISLQEQGSSKQAPVYDKTKAVEIIEKANRLATICRNERYRVAESVENASSNKEVNDAFGSNQYSEIEKSVNI